MKTISSRLYKGSQSWNLDRVVQVGKFKFKVRIHRDSYDHQSWQKGFVYDPEGRKWNELVCRPIEGTSAVSISYVERDELKVQRAFNSDFDEILSELKAITEA